MAWRSLETNFGEILIEILTFSLNEMRLKVSSAKMAAILFRGGDELTHGRRSEMADIFQATFKTNFLD